MARTWITIGVASGETGDEKWRSSGYAARNAGSHPE
jgi:hypothetical protein